MPLTLHSPAFSDGGPIAREYTCEGQDISPPLEWQDPPEGTQSLVLIIDDPDAPDPKAPRMTWVHWVVFNLPPDNTGLVAAASSTTLPRGAEEGLNDWHHIGYGGPCPPVGRHRYFHKLYALNTRLVGLQKPGKPAVEAAMHGHILAQATLVGTYEKSG